MKRSIVALLFISLCWFSKAQISTSAITATLKAYNDVRTGKPVFELTIRNNLSSSLKIPTYFEPYEAGMVNRKTITYLYIYKSDYQKSDPIPIFINPAQHYYVLLPNSQYQVTLQGLDEYNQLTSENVLKAVLVMGYAYNGESFPSQNFPVTIDKTPPPTRTPVDRTQTTGPVDAASRRATTTSTR
jgi:hypothetical protein